MCNVPLQTAMCQSTGSAPAATVPPSCRAALEGMGTTCRWLTSAPSTTADPVNQEWEHWARAHSYFGGKSIGFLNKSLVGKPAELIASSDAAFGDRQTKGSSHVHFGRAWRIQSFIYSVCSVLHFTCSPSMIALLCLCFHITNNCRLYSYKGSLLTLIPCPRKALILTPFTLICPL